MLSQTELSSLILNSWGNDPPKIGNFQAKALLTWTLWHTDLIFLGWIIYTSKHNCACNLTRWGWGEEEKRNGAWADVYMECLWSLILTKPSPVSGGNGLYIQFPFCTPPCFFFSEVVISQDFCSAPCWFACLRSREQTICLFSTGNEDVAVFLLRNGAFFCSYILMDSPESSKHLLRKYFIETSPLPGSAPAKTVSSHLSIWRDVLLGEHRVHNWCLCTMWLVVVLLSWEPCGLPPI